MKGKILVIDDEEGIRFTFRRFLRDAGFEVETAEDFNGALDRIAADDLDLVFSDIILGGKTGIDVLHEIKERNLSCPVVLITGYPNIETAAEAVRLGAFGYLSKPVQKEDILRTADLAVKYKRLSDEKESYRANIEAIFRSVRDAIITVDKESVIIEANEAAKGLCGISREAIGGTFPPPATECRRTCAETLMETVRSKQPLERRRIECDHVKRRSQVVTVVTYPLLDARHRFSGAVMIVRDETRLALLERDLEERRHFGNLIGKSEKMQRVYSLIESLANVQTTVLITGESGTGKELAAQALHYTGDRSNKPLVKVNCSSLSENLLESELFGHVRGAFTGAIRDKVGRFQLADGGTIFLDEVGDISIGTQQRLLRVLQEREFEPVGGEATVKVDVRVIAATNKDLREKVRRGEFREDLFYRLKVVEMTLPPLRERREDLPLLVDHFIRKFNAKLNREIDAVSEEVLRVFMGHSWPGNVRELEHSIEHAFILCRQRTITVEDLPYDLVSASAAQPFPCDPSLGERRVILQALEKTGWNKAKAARILGMSARTMFRKLKEYKITRDADPNDP
ncbi:MAG TPA: sigma 54-interacting transcriptional regulator [Dissulfurispiraceae bacterium]|nr:sigma 54-interacting transcriptional regulator [Dissulfurispiraceae bacterium]